MTQLKLEDKISAIKEASGLPDVPDVIKNNLNQEMKLRPYQEEAFARLIYLLHNPRMRQKPTQLLFQMATGSGKTLIMAGAILHLYTLGYRNFIFFVNSTNIIDKTEDNFLNPQSIKYLFNDPISIADKKIAIRKLDNFQHGNADDINIVFSTIQGLHSRLNTPRENSLTYNDFSDKKIVLISDEAHHINVDTRNGARLSQEETEEIISWEGTVNRIFKQNADNILLEFTATAELTDDNIFNKYFDKIIFDYPLKKFREDGYSKEIQTMPADLTPINRALQAVLLNQYRRKIFEKNKQTIKPVLLFKSKTIAESKAFFEEFCNKIKTLKASEIKAFANKGNPVIDRIFAYLKENKIDIDDIVAELKNDFSEDKCISVNSQEESEEKQIAVNTLEDKRNEYRAIFAVDKLNEGWDVLNLFDIVRLYETRDARRGIPGRTTIKEAQLIGRGARYCPFQITSDQQRYCRKYDMDLDNELRICEELYYHSSYDPKYISELKQALVKIGIKAKDSKEIQLELKDGFKESSFYKNGLLFLNKQQKIDRNQIVSLPTAVISQAHKVRLRTGHSESGLLFADVQAKEYEVKRKECFLKDFGKQTIKKALNKLSFYDFSNLKSFLPRLTSIEDFIEDDNFLGKVKVEVEGDTQQINNLSQVHKLSVAVEVLDSVSKIIMSEKSEYEGTKEFFPNNLKDFFRDKKIEVTIPEGEQERGVAQRDTRNNALRLDLSDKEWHAFTENYGTSEEKALVRFIDKTYEALKDKYRHIYLLRNERFFKIFNFSDGRPLEPDFVLYLAKEMPGESIHYQIFIEPKGSHLIAADKWKEDFLMSLKRNAEIRVLWQNKRFKIWGMPFFNSDISMQGFETEFQNGLLDGKTNK